MSNATVYVALLGEGTPVARPTQAEELGNGLYRLMAPTDYDPEDEAWEFAPGTIVCVERRTEGIAQYLFAVAPRTHES